MQTSDSVAFEAYLSFTCLWHSAGNYPTPGWVITLYPEPSATGTGQAIALNPRGEPVAAPRWQCLTAAEAGKVLALCREAGLTRGDYGIGPSLEDIASFIHHEAALLTTRNAIGAAWPRRPDGIPANPAGMWRAIRELAQQIDNLITGAETDLDACRADVVHVKLGEPFWDFVESSEEIRFASEFRALLLSAGAAPEEAWRKGDLFKLASNEDNGLGQADLAMPARLARAARCLWQQMERCVETAGATGYERAFTDALRILKGIEDGTMSIDELEEGQAAAAGRVHEAHLASSCDQGEEER
jgi:hypothetical protein